ncbi:MAG: AmmeMemoRadiSam system protein B [Candidatus Hydrogenedentes bacterium]|nr:AmmeMemoRadiSam system protein B [Candidatus Hydrogenedentota bacterium]
MRLPMTVSIMTLLLVSGSAFATSGGVHLCVSAGKLFPESTEKLQETVHRFLEEAQAPAPTEPLIACVVPHGPYGISGRVAAEAFKHLRKGQYKRVIVLGASHANMAFENCSIAAVDAYATPMGLVPMDARAVRTLCYSALFSARSMRYAHLQRGFLTKSKRQPLHEYEHSIDIILPFLQDRLGDFELVPILVGKLVGGNNRFSEKRAEAIATHLRKLLDGETLLVVSTDFTHFGNDFSFRPFNSDIFNKIEQLDRAGLKRLALNDSEAFEDFIKKSKVPICGLDALRVLLKILPKRAYGTLLGHEMSGRFYNDENRSVSYAAMNFYLSDKQRPKAPVAPPAPKKVTPDAPDDEVRKAPITFTNAGARSKE